jgi:hypothetical protein
VPGGNVEVTGCEDVMCSSHGKGLALTSVALASVALASVALTSVALTSVALRNGDG